MKYNLTDVRFGRLIALSHTYGGDWNVRCDCGVEKVCAGRDLRSGHTRSCGCLNQEARIARNTGDKHWVHHGLARQGKHAPVYTTWSLMLQRCENTKNPKFKHYGGRGIQVCEAWHKFAVFFADMGDRPEGLTIDRVDNDGNYEPGNCRWATKVEQQANRRNSLTHLTPAARRERRRAQRRARYHELAAQTQQAAATTA